MNSQKVFIFDGPYIENKYNQFFNPNVCHICKLPSKKLVMCNQCYMISYCSNEHEAIHRNSHSEICKIIAKIITHKSLWLRYSSLGEWIESRKGILQQILPSLSRCIYQYETEMIMCAKSCCVCFRQANIRPCNICYSANFCNDHQILFSLFHEKYCDDLLLLLNINITYISGCIETVLHLERS
ncbi:uncharacterized protein LOC116847538 [Odontomachus brunneus]|uniref:uncharacterized protein LOC116847538 n=1 Tax=Odontomachus brunneus TaxID=486640 RepID=UPI0013F2A083|nr:uncharacterized protein LOC116847538 [Odontomachus brunneus]